MCGRRCISLAVVLVCRLPKVNRDLNQGTYFGSGRNSAESEACLPGLRFCSAGLQAGCLGGRPLPPHTVSTSQENFLMSVQGIDRFLKSIRLPK